MSEAVNKIYSEEELKQNINYYMAHKLSELLLERGLISLSEFTKLEELNRQSFYHLWLELMPNLVDKQAVLS